MTYTFLVACLSGIRDRQLGAGTTEWLIHGGWSLSSAMYALASR